MANGIIDGNVLAALISLVALGMAATFWQGNQTRGLVKDMKLKLDLLWDVSPYENRYPHGTQRRPRRR